MLLHKNPGLDDVDDCPYLPNRLKQFSYFLASDLNQEDLSLLLAQGWRKFGWYYFRPACFGCLACTPLRIPTASFCPSRSQRRVARKNSRLRMIFGPLAFSQRVYEIYRDHALQRFGQSSTEEDFLLNFFTPSCPALQSQIYVDDTLVGVGFLDRGENCLSSVYFAFDPHYAELNLGTFSILQEIAYARSQGLSWYYLGYYVRDCQRLAYKDAFRPRQYFDWTRQLWFDVEREDDQPSDNHPRERK